MRVLSINCNPLFFNCYILPVFLLIGFNGENDE